MTDKLKYIGHRGTNFNCDENTIEAFKKAIDYGADSIELDIRLSKDKICYILHNPKIYTLYNHQAFIKNLNSYELKKIKSKNYNYNIPTLEKIFKDLKTSKIIYILDIKVRKILNEVVQIVEKYNLSKKVIISSANFEDLKLLTKYHSNYKKAFVVNDKKKLDNILKKIARNEFPVKLEILSLSSKIVTKDIIENCKRLNIQIYIWGFWYYDDPLPIIKEHIRNGIQGIFFDNCENIIKIKKWIANIYNN